VGSFGLDVKLVVFGGGCLFHGSFTGCLEGVDYGGGFYCFLCPNSRPEFQKRRKETYETKAGKKAQNGAKKKKTEKQRGKKRRALKTPKKKTKYKNQVNQRVRKNVQRQKKKKGGAGG